MLNLLGTTLAIALTYCIAHKAGSLTGLVIAGDNLIRLDVGVALACLVFARWRAMPGLLIGEVLIHLTRTGAGFAWPQFLIDCAFELLTSFVFLRLIGWGKESKTRQGTLPVDNAQIIRNLVVFSITGSIGILESGFEAVWAGSGATAGLQTLLLSNWAADLIGILLVVPVCLHIRKVIAGKTEPFDILNVAGYVLLAGGPFAFMLHYAAESRKPFDTAADPIQDVVSWTLLVVLAGLGIALFAIFRQQSAANVQQNISEQRLLESEKRFRSFAQIGADWMWETDPQCEYTAFWGSGPLPRGRDAEYFLGRPCHDIVPPEDVDVSREPWKSHLAAVRSRHEFTDFVNTRRISEDVVVTVSTSAIPLFDAKGGFLGYRGVTTDITKKIGLELRIASAEARLRGLVSASPGVLYVTDTGREGNIRYLADSVQDLLGYSAEELKREPDWCISLVHPDDLSAELNARRLLVETGEKSSVYRLRKKDGGYRWVQDTARISVQADNLNAEIIGVLIDVTEKRKVDEQLRDAQKLEAIGQLTGGLAHDFNNLLGIVIGNLDLLEREFPEQLSLNPRVGNARDAAMRGGEVTRALLSVARQQVMNAKIVDVGDVLERLYPLLKSSLGSDNAVEVFNAPGPIMVELDEAAFSQALLNVSLNACDALAECNRSGTFAITVSEQDLDDIDGLALGIPQGRYLRLEMQDDGIGISEAAHARAFEPFFTTKDRKKRTGLGLPMVYGFARQLGGIATVDKLPDQGCKVNLYLPVADPKKYASLARHPVPAKAASTSLQAGQTLRVLVVDDEPDLGETASTMLNVLGYATRVAESGKEALALLEQAPFEIMFSDVTMPGGMSGTELASRVRDLYPHVQILLTSGYSIDLLKENSDQWPLLRKPYSLADLTEAMKGVSQALQIPAPS